MKWFFGKKKSPETESEEARPALIDEDETIVINLTGDDSVEPADVRVEFETSEQTTVASAPVHPVAQSKDGDVTEVWTMDETVAPTAAAPSVDAPARAPDASPEHTAGWLMIIDGEGQGRLFGVSLGRNKVGRGAENEIQIDNGDSAISKSNHVTLAADPKTQRYYLIPGDSTNLAYVSDEPLLQPVEIEDKAVIQLGGTTLTFIQVFGNYVDWS